MSHDALPLIDAATRGALAVLLALLAAALWRERRRLAAVGPGAALALGLLVQVGSGAPAVDTALPRAWLAPLVGVSVGNAVLFWLFARALFDDGFRPAAWQAGLWLAVVAVGAAGAWLCGPGVALTGGLGLLAALKSWLPLVFALLALAEAARQWRADLLEGRRRLRLFIVGAGALDSAAMVAARLASGTGRVDAAAAWLDVAVLLAIAVVMAWQLLRLGEGGLFPLVPVPAVTGPGLAAPPVPGALPDAADPAEQRLAEDLRRAMEQACAYKDEALTVARLAERLKVPEYRLRRVINQRLGFRNFNAFVNGYRLAEARAALADPARRELPVLSIALEAGFGSIGPFNRAFKADTGLTPTEFRRQALADS